MRKLNQKIKNLSDYPFDRLRELLSKVILPENSRVIDLSIGQPYHDIPSFVKSTILNAGEKWHLYPPIAGIKDLRAAYLGWLKRRFKLDKNFFSEDILPLSGTREGLFSVVLTLNINNIIVPNPFYQAYLGASLFQNLNIKYLGSDNANNSFFDLEDLEKNLKGKRSLVYFCSPSNPQGKVASFLYIKKLINLVRKHDAVLIVDECYTDIFFKKIPEGAIKVCEELGEGLKNILIFHSLSKRSNVAGMRSGFVVGDKEIIYLFKRLRSYSAPSMPIPIQLASAKLWNDEKHVLRNRQEYEKKFNYANRVFSEYEFYEKTEAGFYLWINVGNGSNFAKELYKEHLIKVMPGEYLANGEKNNPGKKYIRIALVHNFIESRNAINKIAQLLKC